LLPGSWCNGGQVGHQSHRCPKRLSIANADSSYDNLAEAIDASLYNDTAIIIVIKNRASEATPFPGVAVATGHVIARAVVTWAVDTELELDLGLRGTAQGRCSRDGSGNQESPQHGGVSFVFS
jgi:hypothetical protein